MTKKACQESQLRSMNKALKTGLIKDQTKNVRSARGVVKLFCRKKMSERSELLFPAEKLHRAAEPATKVASRK
ncbi:hypothetical protein [Marinobacter sp.]|uniref:hypothetical protein n=1 Tax=Marinobacter sp. TaxID=50741 RepID=UPI003A94DBDD